MIEHALRRLAGERVKLEDQILITEGGPVLLAEFPLDLRWVETAGFSAPKDPAADDD